MNKAESDWVAGYFDSLGCERVMNARCADIIVLNTCVVRQSAEDKVLGMLSFTKGLKSRKPDLKLLVTGCFVDSDVDKLQKKFPYVDHFFGPGCFSELASWATRQPSLTATGNKFRNGASPTKSKTVSALLPIIQGCDNFCSYCIVPYRRGREKSRPLPQIVSHVENLALQGIKEVILLGQNVDSYGHDLSANVDLAMLLSELNKIDGIKRIRFLTNHPKDMNRRLIEAVATLDKVCEHISLPLQSGDNRILDAMKRGYTVEKYKELVNTIRQSAPEIAISTDVIVGFPGENEEHFQRTLSVLEELRFDVVHVAAYSPRPGTLAAREYQDNVPPDVKMERLRKIEELQARIAGEINTELVGKIVEVLVEGRKGDKWFGRTRTNKLTFFPSANDCLGQLVSVLITKASPWALQGELAG